MKHMEKVNKGLEYMYPSRGKGSNRKEIPRNPKNTQLAKKAWIKAKLGTLKFPAYQQISHTLSEIIEEPSI